MSSGSKKHSFLADEGTPLEVVINYIKAAPGRTLKKEIEDWAALMHYPYALYQSGASFEEIAMSTFESLRRFNQEISMMTGFLNAVAIAKGEPPIMSSLGCSLAEKLSRPPLHSSLLGKTSTEISAPRAIAEDVEPSVTENKSEEESKPKRLSKYVVEPF